MIPDVAVAIELSDTKIRFTIGGVVLTSKLIDGTFPDYQRVIPTGNDKRLIIDRETFARAVDRVSTVSSERGRAVKLSIGDGQVTLAVNNPDSGSATEELAAEYAFRPDGDRLQRQDICWMWRHSVSGETHVSCWRMPARRR